MFEIIFLGTSASAPSVRRGLSSQMVKHDEYRFLIDCGATSMSALKHWRVSPNSIDAILLTHLHGDHFGGIPFFILDAQLVSRRTRPLNLAGPAGTEQRIHAAQEVLFPGSSQVHQRYTINYFEWAAGRPQFPVSGRPDAGADSMPAA